MCRGEKVASIQLQKVERVNLVTYMWPWRRRMGDTSLASPNQDLLRKKIFFYNRSSKKYVIVKIYKVFRQPRNSPQYRFNRERVKRWQRSLNSRKDLLMRNNTDTRFASRPESKIRWKLVIS